MSRRRSAGRSVVATLARHEETRSAGGARRPRGRGHQEGAVLLSTLLCSSTAADRYGDLWTSACPDLELLTLPTEGRLEAAQVDRIDLALFSDDLWDDGRGRAFFGVALHAPALRWLHIFSAGLDDPVFTRLEARGVTVTGSAGASAVPIAHTVVMHLLALCRRADHHARAQVHRQWAQTDGLDLEGRSACVVGLGNIGREVARLLPHFGMEVVGVRRTPDGTEPCRTVPIGRLHDVLQTTDDLILTAALNDGSRGLIGAVEMGLLPSGAHIVNVGRGELVDEAALVQALADGHLGGAALDVFTTEPLEATSPLWDMPGVIITPHAAGRTPLVSMRAAEIFTDNLQRWRDGRPLRNTRAG